MAVWTFGTLFILLCLLKVDVRALFRLCGADRGLHTRELLEASIGRRLHCYLLSKTERLAEYLIEMVAKT